MNDRKEKLLTQLDRARTPAEVDLVKEKLRVLETQQE